MDNLIGAELYKTTHRKTFGICLVFAAAVEFLNGFLHGGDQIDTMTLLIEIIGLLTCALFAGLFIGADFSSRTIFHAVTSGKNRACVWISKYLSFMAVSLIILLVNILAVNVSVILFHGTSSILLPQDFIPVLAYDIAGVCYDLCLASLFFLISMVVKEGGISIAVSTVLIGVIISNSRFLWVDRLFPLGTVPAGSFLLIIPVPLAAMFIGIMLFKKRNM